MKGNEDSIFAEALGKPDSERSIFLDQACASDTELRQRVEGLLAMADARFPMIESGSLASTLAIKAPIVSIGDLTADTVIGPYRLIEKLGEGGFGLVWKAEQSEPLKRTVALKLLKRGEDSAEIVARFAQERQALALMSHPNIAQVFDAGKMESGRPFFVMELVEGEVLTKYCDARQLTIRQRLDIFLQVCEGVQHAHQKGIIHRDLKPSNVLVAINEGGNAIPKVIDFGIAKALTPELAEEALIIHSLAIMGTPVYMSPEQALGDPGIDTRTDLYSLGVILYELLTGFPPFDPKELLRKPVDEMLRFIREQEPRKPSTQVTGADEETGRSLAEARSTVPARMAGELRGDLDWIVLKALAKEPDRRYRSASELAEDIGRHLAGEPVMAAPPSTIYRCRKFVRKHRFSVTAAALLILVLIAGLAATSWQLYRGNTYRDIAGKSVDHIAKRAGDAWMTNATVDVLPLVDPDLEPLARRHAAESEKWGLEGGKIRTRFQRFFAVAGVGAGSMIKFEEDKKLAAAVSWLRSIAETSDTRLIENRWKQFELGLACAHMAFVLESAHPYSRSRRRYAESESEIVPIWNAQPSFGDDPIVWRIRAQYLWLNLMSNEAASDSEISLGGIARALDAHNAEMIEQTSARSTASEAPQEQKKNSTRIPSPLIAPSKKGKADETNPSTSDEDTAAEWPFPAERSLLEDLAHWNAEKIRNSLSHRGTGLTGEGSDAENPAGAEVVMSFAGSDRNLCIRRDGNFELVPIRPRRWLPYLVSDEKIDPEKPLDKPGLRFALEGIDKAISLTLERPVNQNASAYFLGLHDALSLLRSAHDNVSKGSRVIRSGSTGDGKSGDMEVYSWWKHAEEAGKLAENLEDPALQSLRLDFLRETLDIDKLISPEDVFYFSSHFEKPISPKTRAAFHELYGGWLLEKIALLEASPTGPESRRELLRCYAAAASPTLDRKREDRVRMKGMLTKAKTLITDYSDELLLASAPDQIAEIAEVYIEIAEKLIRIGDTDSAVAVLETIIGQGTEASDDPLNESRANALVLVVDSLGQIRRLEKAEALFDLCLRRIARVFSEESGIEDHRQFAAPWFDASDQLAGHMEIGDSRWGSDPERAARLLSSLADGIERAGITEEERAFSPLEMAEWRIDCARYFHDAGQLKRCWESLDSSCQWLLRVAVDLGQSSEFEHRDEFVGLFSRWLDLQRETARETPNPQVIPDDSKLVESGVTAAFSQMRAVLEIVEKLDLKNVEQLELDSVLYPWSEFGQLVGNYAEWARMSGQAQTAIDPLETADNLFSELTLIVSRILVQRPAGENFPDPDPIIETVMAWLRLAESRAELLSDLNRTEDALSVLEAAQSKAFDLVRLIPENQARSDDDFPLIVLWTKLKSAELLKAAGQTKQLKEFAAEALRQAEDVDAPAVAAEFLSLTGDNKAAGAVWTEESNRQSKYAKESILDEDTDVSDVLSNWVSAAESAEKAYSLINGAEDENSGDPAKLLERARFESGKCRGLLDRRVLTLSIPELVQTLERVSSEEPDERRRFELAEIEGYLLALLSPSDGDIWVKSLGFSRNQWDGIDEPNHPLTLIALASIHAIEPGSLALEIGRHSPTPVHADWLLKTALERNMDSEMARLSAGILKKQGRNAADSRMPSLVLETETTVGATGKNSLELEHELTFRDSRSIHDENASFDITSVAVRKPVDGRTEFVLSFAAAPPETGHVFIWVDADCSAKTGDRFWGDIGSDFNIKIAFDPKNHRIETTAPSLDCRRQFSERQLQVFIEGWRWEEFDFVVQENVSWRIGANIPISSVQSGAAITLDGAIQDWKEQHISWTSEESESEPGFSMADLRRVQACWIGDSLYGALSYPMGAKLYGDGDVSTGKPSMSIRLPDQDRGGRQYVFGVEEHYHIQQRPKFIRSPESAAYEVQDATLEFEIRDVLDRNAGAMRVSTLIQKSDFVPDSARSRSGHLEGRWRVQGTTAFNGNHHKVLATPRNWERARTYCESLGGHLAIVNSPEEHEFLCQLKLKHLGEKSWAWLGGHQPETGGDWVWVDGNPIETNHWNPRKIDTHPEERFLILDGQNLWSGCKIESKLVKGFICEWETGKGK